MADKAIGATGVITFRRDRDFAAAAVRAAIVLPGDAIGHVRQVLIAGNFAPGGSAAWCRTLDTQTGGVGHRDDGFTGTAHQFCASKLVQSRDRDIGG